MWILVDISLKNSFPTNFQSRTDRIVFKLFGKDPNDFPIVLRTQVFTKTWIYFLCDLSWGILFHIYLIFVICFTSPDFQLVISQSYRHWELYKARLYHINNIPPSRKIHMGWGMCPYWCQICRIANPSIMDSIFRFLTTFATYSSAVIWDPI